MPMSTADEIDNFQMNNFLCKTLIVVNEAVNTSMFQSKNKKNNVYPAGPKFYYIIMGFEGS